MENLQPSFYANIPAFVRYDKDLKPNAKLLYGEITALTSAKGYCWAGNEYFAKLYNVDPATVSRWISQLSKKGYISLKMKYKGNTKVIAERKIYLSNSHFMDDEKVNQMDDKKIIHMDDEKVKDITTSFINTNNIKDMSETKVSNDIASSNKKASAATETNLIESQFDEWWNLYDNKTNKAASRPLFKKMVKQYGYEQLKSNTEFYVSRFTTDKTYQKNPDKFLKNYDPEDKMFNRNGYNSFSLNNNTNPHQGASAYKEVKEEDLYNGGEWE